MAVFVPKRTKRQTLAIIILCVLLAITMVSNILLTVAYFSDKDNAGSVIIIGNIIINARIVENNGVLTFDNNQVIAGSTTNKTLAVSVPEDSGSCYFRMKTEFRIDDVTVTDILFLSVGSSDVANWTEDATSNYWYFNGVLSYTGNEREIPLVFSISSYFGNVDPTDPEYSYLGKPYSIKLIIEVIQSANNDGSDGWVDAPQEWITALNA